MRCNGFLSIVFISVACSLRAQIIIHSNQVAYDSRAAKIAVIQTSEVIERGTEFRVIAADDETKVLFHEPLGSFIQMNAWFSDRLFYCADFSALKKPGRYIIQISVGKKQASSAPFIIGDNQLGETTVPAILDYFNKQRANTPQEWKADEQVILFGSNKTANVQGGWCDASGDVSKYFSHLAYTNYMLPQQTPFVTWSLADTRDALPQVLKKNNSQTAIEDEALWGADYLVRSLSPDGYFYMTVFSYFNPDPSARRIVGLLANSVTTADYQCGFREGGGMAVAALARVAAWNKSGTFNSNQYLDAAKKAFAHLLINSISYIDDHKENIIDDYSALLASTELWITTQDSSYSTEARKRAANLCGRISAEGYFLAGDSTRPFWHASDAGMPVIALARYLAIEKNEVLRNACVVAIRKYLDYLLQVTNEVPNPFGYARQSFLYNDRIQDGFFIPHVNESGWWWQGENARLASLAAAAVKGSDLALQGKKFKAKADSLNRFAWQQVSWILGNNPYDICFMYGFGQKNTPPMTSMFGHGAEKGGISNGITGKDGYDSGSGIDYKTSANGNEWRWTEQWLPHAAWFLQALSALEK